MLSSVTIIYKMLKISELTAFVEKRIPSFFLYDFRKK